MSEPGRCAQSATHVLVVGGASVAEHSVALLAACVEHYAWHSGIWETDALAGPVARNIGTTAVQCGAARVVAYAASYCVWCCAA